MKEANEPTAGQGDNCLNSIRIFIISFIVFGVQTSLKRSYGVARGLCTEI